MRPGDGGCSEPLCISTRLLLCLLVLDVGEARSVLLLGKDDGWPLELVWYWWSWELWNEPAEDWAENRSLDAMISILPTRNRVLDRYLTAVRGARPRTY